MQQQNRTHGDGQVRNLELSRMLVQEHQNQQIR